MTEVPEKSNVEIRVGRYVGEVGRIDRAFLGFEDHGVFAVDLGFAFEGSHQGLGYIVLSCSQGSAEKAMALLQDLIRVVGAIPDCIGHSVLVLRDDVGFNEPIRGLRQIIGPAQVVFGDYR